MYLIGQATDIHRLKKQFRLTPIVLGGYKFKTKYKIIAHSDGDLVLHAIANALLGCLQQKDIGHYFSDKNILNKNLDSRVIISYALSLLKKHNARIINIDMTILCENIILESNKKNIIESLQTILESKAINIKATRFEKRSNIIQCDVVLLVEKKEK